MGEIGGLIRPKGGESGGDSGGDSGAAQASVCLTSALALAKSIWPA